jgi:hypothetical protein
MAAPRKAAPVGKVDPIEHVEVEGEAPEGTKPEDAKTPESPEAPALDADEAEHRMETYEVVRQDGEVVRVLRNLDTGEATYEVV